jgi:hypothetical protein
MSAQHPAEPSTLENTMRDLIGAGTRPPFNPLRLAMHGQNAPVCAQLVHLLVRELPHDVARHPGSAEFRNAARAWFATQSFYIEPTRSDYRAGVLWLARRDLLPVWVFPDDARGADYANAQ